MQTPITWETIPVLLNQNYTLGYVYMIQLFIMDGLLYPTYTFEKLKTIENLFSENEEVRITISHMKGILKMKLKSGKTFCQITTIEDLICWIILMIEKKANCDAIKIVNDEHIFLYEDQIQKRLISSILNFYDRS